jgi:SAM-dependent methyltransferase
VVTKKNRNLGDSLPIEKRIESYFRGVGMDGDQDGKVFRQGLRAKHGRIADRIADAIAAREEGEDVDIYVLKNNTLALSIDVTAQYCRRMYEEFLVWFLRARFPKPQSLLDVGCDNGILTCFYATVYPEAEVVGIDRGDQGIACARELAGRLDLVNVRFEERDLLSLDDVFPDQSFDLIVSTTVFHEVLEAPTNLPEISIDAVTIGPDESDSVKIVTDLSRLLREETGGWLSMERWPDASSLAWWIRLLNHAGLSVRADQSTLLTFCTVDGEQERLPILVATRQRRRAVDSGEPMLAFRIYPHDPVVT